MLSIQKVNLLGNILDTTYGRSGTSASGTSSIKYSLAGDILTLKFTRIVHFAGEQSLRSQVDKYTDEAVDVLGKYLTEVKKIYKEVSGEALKLKDVRSDDDVEMVSMNNMSPRKVAYYRRNHVLQIQN
tara:strand:+ start:1878 stop:2261 length:384 start_codon:yes stop_codon:yes gene_type:complete